MIHNGEINEVVLCLIQINILCKYYINKYISFIENNLQTRIKNLGVSGEILPLTQKYEK